jgi:hypothetical protein
MNNYKNSLVNARSFFKSKDKKYIIWFHYMIKNGETFLYFDSNNNLGKSEADSNVDVAWSEALDSYYGSFDNFALTYNDKDLSDIKAHRKKDVIKNRNIIPDCSKHPCDNIWEKRDWCCFFNDFERGYSLFHNSMYAPEYITEEYIQNLYERGLIAGVNDGLRSIVLFLRGKWISDEFNYNPAKTQTKFVLKVIFGENYNKAVIDRDKAWEIYKLKQGSPVFSSEFWKQIIDGLKEALGSVVFQTSLMQDKLLQQAYENGLITFNVILFEVSGGSKLLANGVKFTGKSAKFVSKKLKGAYKSAVEYKSILKNSVAKYAQNKTNFLKLKLLLPFGRLETYLDFFFGKGKWKLIEVDGKIWVKYVDKSGLTVADVHELGQLEVLGAKLQKEMIHLEKGLDGFSFQGIDGFTIEGIPVTLKRVLNKKMSRVSDRLRDMGDGVDRLNKRVGGNDVITDAYGKLSAKKITIQELIKKTESVITAHPNEFKNIKRILLEGKDGTSWFDL